MAASITSSGITLDSITKNGKFEPFELQVSRGQITGHSVVNIFGFLPSSSFSAGGIYRTVWENSPTTDYAFPSSAVTMSLVSTNNSDTATILIVGLDANYNLISETLALNGTTSVPTVNKYFRINNMSVAIGSPTNPAGVITLTNGGVTYAQISTSQFGAGAGNTASIGTSQMALYTVPAGYSLYLSRFDAFSSYNGNTANYLTYRAVTNTSAGVQKIILQSPWDSTYEIQRKYPFSYASGTDIRWQVATSGTTAVSVGINIEGVLIANDGSF